MSGANNTFTCRSGAWFRAATAGAGGLESGLGGGAFLPVHWGTFSLAMHAWDQPAEKVLELGDKAGVQLVMPRLGEPVEPAHAEKAEPWWRAVDMIAMKPEPDTSAAITLPKAMPWPID